jgi:hypothetical protein
MQMPDAWEAGDEGMAEGCSFGYWFMPNMYANTLGRCRAAAAILTYALQITLLIVRTLSLHGFLQTLPHSS